MFLHKKDPEGRNVIVICLLNASNNVLEAIWEMFGEHFDVKQLILKQEYDFNPSFNMALSLCAFDKYSEQSLKVV